MRFATGMASALTLAIVTASATVRAETPLTSSVVRTIPLRGWNLTCFGMDATLGRCLAVRRYRSMTIEIASDPEAAIVSVAGGCPAHPGWIEARRVRTDAGEAEAVAELAERLVAIRLRNCGDLPARGGFLRSLRDAAARVGELTRWPA